MCYILWYSTCYMPCCVQAGLLDQPRIENQWCYIAGYDIPKYIARAILSAMWHMVMLYSMSIYHAIQQIRLYSSPHIQHLAIQHIFYAIQHMHIPCYLAGKAIYLPSYMALSYIAHISAIQHMHVPCYTACQAIQLSSYIASCYIAHILCFIAHSYSRCYIAPGYIAHRSAIQQCLQQGSKLYSTSARYIA